MSDELTTYEAQSIYDHARRLFASGMAIGDAWDHAMAADRITLEFAPPEIAAALSGGGGGEKRSSPVDRGCGVVVRVGDIMRCDHGDGGIEYWYDDAHILRNEIASLESRLAAAEKDLAEVRKHLADVLHAESVLEQKLAAAEKRAGELKDVLDHEVRNVTKWFERYRAMESHRDSLARELAEAKKQGDAALARVKELDGVVDNVVLSLSYAKPKPPAAAGAQP